MTKQEEIREGIGRVLLGFSAGLHEVIHHTDETGDYTAIAQKEDNFINSLLSYLHSKKCRIEVKCPYCEWSQFVGEESVGMTPCHSCNSTGYLIEPLIENGK